MKAKIQSAIVFAACLCRGGSAAHVLAQATPPPADLRPLVADICQQQIAMLQRHDTRLRYETFRVDRKGQTLRDQIESHDGAVARLLQVNKQPVSAEENAGDRQRLQGLLGSGRVQARARDEARNRTYGAELLQSLPDAMLWSVAPQQSAVPDVSHPQWVLDFRPNPAFQPHGVAQQMLPALNGRVWIDASDRQLLRMELHNASEVNLAWGLLAKVYAGGMLTYEQRRFQELYAFTHIVMHLRVRELMVKTQALDSDLVASNFRRLPESPSSDEAIRMLLAEPVVTR